MMVGVSVAQAGMFTNSRAIQTFPAESGESVDPELVAEESGMLGYYNVYTTGGGPIYNLAHNSRWFKEGGRVFYNPKTQNIFVLMLKQRDGQKEVRTYRLKAEPMQKALAALADHWQEYKSYIEKPTPAGEEKVKGFADIAAALASVEDKAERYNVQFGPDELNDKAAYTAMLEKLQNNPQIADPRLTGRRNDAFGRFIRSEGKKNNDDRGSMFAPIITEKEATAGLTTKIQLHYLGAWLHAIGTGYLPKVFKTVGTDIKINNIPEPTAAMAEFFAKVDINSAGQPDPFAPETVHRGKFDFVAGYKIGSVLDEEYLVGAEVKSSSVDGNGRNKSYRVKISEDIAQRIAAKQLKRGDKVDFFIVDGEIRIIGGVK